MTRIKLTNGFPNTNGKGILLTAEILQGKIEATDCLSLPDGSKVSILEIEEINFKAYRQHVALTVARETEKELKWHELFGSEIEIEKNTTYNST